MVFELCEKNKNINYSMTNPRLYMKIHDLCDMYRYFLYELDCNIENGLIFLEKSSLS